MAPTSLGTPRRAVVGWDQSRLSMVLAVLEAHCGVRLSGHDVYLNVAGGLAHPGAGRRPRRRRRAGVVARQCAAAGRRGLFRRGLAVGRGASGGAGAARLKEAQKLGFARAIVPEAARAEGRSDSGLTLESVASLANLVADIAARGKRAASSPTAARRRAADGMSE